MCSALYQHSMKESGALLAGLHFCEWKNEVRMCVRKHARLADPDSAFAFASTVKV